MTSTFQKEICFTSANFNRQALKRSDKIWINAQLADTKSRFLLFWNNRFLTTNDSELRFLDKSTAEQYDSSDIHWKYMGELDVTIDDDVTPISIFGAEIIETTDITINANWQSLRSIGLLLSPEIANLLAYTQGLLNWHSSNDFCSYCGESVNHNQAGHALICSNADCGREIFPRTDPAVIVLVYHEDACLLGRAETWPEKMYSCLAGFVETGEDLNAAVKREVHEESGLLLKNIQYRGSQPWPFPQSLMLGFHAEAIDKDLTFHDGEIHQANWYSRQQLLDAVANNELNLSSSLSISYHLIEDWFNQKSEQSLSELIKP